MFRPAALALALVICCVELTRAETFRFAVTDVSGIEGARRSFGPLREALQALAGIDLDFVPTSHRVMAVQLLAEQRVDLVFSGPAEYVALRNRAGAEPTVGVERPDYRSHLVVLAEGGIRTIDDLRSARVGLGPRGSTSRHLAPLQLLADLGLVAERDFSVHHLNGGLLLEGLQRGSLAAIAMNSADLARIQGAASLPALRMLASSGTLPIDVLAASPQLSPARRERLRDAIAQHAQALADALAQGENMESYRGMRWRLDAIDDRLFDDVRRMYATIGIPEFARAAK